MVHEWNMDREQWWDRLQRKMEVLGDKIVPIASSSSTNLTWNLTGRKASLCSERLRVWFISQSMFTAKYTPIIPIIPANHGFLNFLWLRATPFILGWFEVRRCKNNSNWCTLLPKLLWNFYSIRTIYKCGCEPHNTTWRAAGWRSKL